MKQEQYAAAKDLYIDVMKEREIPWAKIGLGKSLISLKEFDAAKTIFRELIKEQPNVVESYDWLSQIEVSEKKPREAQDTLE